MANISNATGTVIIEANSFDVLEELKKCFEIASNWWYYTNCLGLYDKELIDEVNESSADEIGAGHLRYYIIYKFDGAGRWSFSHNIQNFMRWLEEDKDKFNSELLINSDFIIMFEYVDQESGCSFITESKDELTHLAGDSDTIYRNIYEINHEYTLVNRAKYTGYGLLVVLQDEFEGWDDDEMIFNTLYRQKRDIEQYVGEPLGVYLSQNGLKRYITIYNKFIVEKGEKILKY